MKLAFVEIEGFRGFREHVRFELPPGFAVITGRNGAGKSSVFDAVDFALTGTISRFAVKPGKRSPLDDHIWWVGDGKPKNEFVKVGFATDEGELLVVTRSRQGGLEPSQEEILRQLVSGADAANRSLSTLVQTALIRGETIASLSLDLSDQARFATVDAALGVTDGLEHEKRLVELVSVSKQRHDMQSVRVSRLQTELSQLLHLLTEARSEAERQPDIRSAVLTVQKLVPEYTLDEPLDLIALRDGLVTRREATTRLEGVLTRLSELKDDLQRLETPTFVNELTSAQGEAAQAREALAVAERELGFATERLRDLKGHSDWTDRFLALLEHGEHIGVQDGHCPLCGAARTADAFLQAIAQARARLMGTKSLLAEAELEAEKAREQDLVAQAAVVEAERRVQALLRQGEQTRAEIETTRRKAAELLGVPLPDSDEELVRGLVRQREENTQLERALLTLEASGAQDKVVTLEQRVGRLREQLDIEVARLTSTERSLRIARQIEATAKVVSNQILTEQFDTVLPLLKELYQRLRPHSDWHELNVDFGGRVRASLNFSVGRNCNPRFLFSSGQRRTAGLAFLLAVHLARSWCRLATLMLDDPVQHVDDYRALNLIEVLAAIRRSGRQVIVAVEDPALADVLCRRLRSRTVDGGRRIEVFSNERGSCDVREQTEVYPLAASILRIA